MANCAILAISYPHGVTPTITDDASNTWPAAAKVVDNGVGNMVAAVYVLPSPAAATKITVAFGSTVNMFQYTYSEWGNILSASPVDVTSGSATTGTTSGSNLILSTGSMSPTSGDLIFNYYAPGITVPGQATLWVSGGSFTLLDADITFFNSNNGSGGFQHASQWFIATGGSINPSITANGEGGSGDTFNTIAVALKASGGTPSLVQHVSSTTNLPYGTTPLGNNFVCPLIHPMGSTPSGMWIYKILHFSAGSGQASPYKFQLPSVGNLRALITPAGTATENITGLTDNESNTWTQVTPVDTSAPQIMWLGNTSANPNLLASLAMSTVSGARGTSYRYYDIAGAATSPFDVSSGVTDHPVSAGAISEGSITPTVSGLVIATGQLGNGPGLSVTAPTGSVFDLCTYSNEDDSDNMENADLVAHLIHTGSATYNFSWTIANNTDSSAMLIAFKSAAITIIYDGWEIQSFQPPYFPKANSKSAALSHSEDGIEGKFINFSPDGWQIQHIQPPNSMRPNQKTAALSHPEDGIEGLFIPPPAPPPTPSTAFGIIGSFVSEW